VILGSCAEEGDAADVYLFDSVGDGAVWLRDRRGEWVEVADDDGDGRNGLGLEILLI
jgi:hypothetical protein